MIIILKRKNRMKLKIKVIIVLTIFMFCFLKCQKCLDNKKDINYGTYESNSIKGEVIVLKSNGTYLHIVDFVNYRKKSTWALNNCEILLYNYSDVIDKVSNKLIDTTETGIKTFLIYPNRLTNTDEIFGYTFKLD